MRSRLVLGIVLGLLLPTRARADLSVKLDNFLVGTGAATTTVVRSGWGFQPKALIGWTVGRTDAANAVGGATTRTAIGFAASATDRGTVTILDVDAAANSDVGGGNDDTAFIRTFTEAGGLDGLLDIQSIDSGGVTFVIDDQFATDVRVFLLALGGSDITNVDYGNFQDPAAIGNVDYTTPGFQPDIVFFMGSNQTAIPSGTAFGHGVLAFGYGISSSNRATMATSHRNAINTMQTARHGISLEAESIIAPTGAESVNWRADFVGMISTGFTLNWLEITSGTQFFHHYLAIKGASWAAGESATRTDTTQFSLSGFGFQPSAMLFGSHGAAESTQNAAATEAMLIIGAAAGASDRFAATESSQDALADAEVATGHRFDAVYAHADLADGHDGLMDVVSFDSGGATLVMDDADPTANWFFYVAVGPSGAAPPCTPTLALMGVGKCS